MLQIELPKENIKELRLVRDVAPSKFMYIISFTVPKELIVKQMHYNRR